MSYPGPPADEGERPLEPDYGPGGPAPATDQATSTDFGLPANPPVDPDPTDLIATDVAAVDSVTTSDPLGTTGVGATSPVYDDPVTLVEPVPGTDSPVPAGGGLLDKVKAFAGQRPELFLAAALVAGWLAGRLTSSSDDGSED